MLFPPPTISPRRTFNALRTHYAKMSSIFSYASQVAITGGTITQVNNHDGGRASNGIPSSHTFVLRYIANNDRSSAFEMLIRAAAPNALYNSGARYDTPRCHPRTRRAVLERIMQ